MVCFVSIIDIIIVSILKKKIVSPQEI